MQTESNAILMEMDKIIFLAMFNPVFILAVASLGLLRFKIDRIFKVVRISTVRLDKGPVIEPYLFWVL